MHLTAIELAPLAVAVMLTIPLALLSYRARCEKHSADHLFQLNAQLQRRLATLENRVQELDLRVENPNRQPSKEVQERIAMKPGPLPTINSPESGLPIDPSQELEKAIREQEDRQEYRRNLAEAKAYNDRDVFSLEEITSQLYSKTLKYGRPNRWTWNRCAQIAQTIEDAKPKKWGKVEEITQGLIQAVERQQLRIKDINAEEIHRRFGAENFHPLGATQTEDPFTNEPTWEEHLAELYSRPEVQRFLAEVARLDAWRDAQEAAQEPTPVEEAAEPTEQTPAPAETALEAPARPQGPRSHETPSNGAEAPHRPGKLPRGVKRTKNGKYAAQRTVNGKYLSKGGFTTPEAAHQHYLELGQSASPS